MKIQFINGERAGETVDFQETEISIGREEGNSIQLLTGGVSRYHAQICKKITAAGSFATLTAPTE